MQIITNVKIPYTYIDAMLYTSDTYSIKIVGTHNGFPTTTGYVLETTQIYGKDTCLLILFANRFQ